MTYTECLTHTLITSAIRFPASHLKKNFHKKFDKSKSLYYLCEVFKKHRSYKVNKKKFTKMFDKLKNLSYLCRPTKKRLTSVIKPMVPFSKIENSFFE